MDHIVNQIAALNTITETLVRITYIKTEYRCPTKAEIEYDEYDYNEEYHHHYSSKHFICILSVYGSKDDDWGETSLFLPDLYKGKVHAKRLEHTIKDINERGIRTENSRNNAVYETDHHHLIITKVEMMN